MLDRATAVARRGALTARDVALDVAGGPARAKVVLILAALLGLSGADTGTISATASNLEHVFHIGNTQIGVLTSVSAAVGAVFTLPAGVLTDRTRRTRILAVAVLLWAGAMVASGGATSFLWLLLSRIALGAVLAVAGPAVASLTGDFFPAGERGRMYGLILGGELVGTGIGYIVSGDISSLGSWRYAFWWLAVPSLALAWRVWKLPEPARGGQSRLAPGAEHIPDQREVNRQASEAGGPRDGSAIDRTAGPAGGEGQRPTGGAEGADARRRDSVAWRAAQRSGAEPDPALVLHEDPTGRSLWWAVRYVLRVRTNVVMIIASALGYFYFDGLRTFAVIYATSHYRISKPTATALIVVLGAGALAGVYVGGRVADRLLRRGHVRARVIVPLVALLAIIPMLAPAIATTTVAIAIPLLIVGASLLGAPNPPMDAARLDIMHPKLWGRAEAIRTVLRTAADATAPTLFGYVSQYVFGHGAGGAGPGGSGGGMGGGGTAGQAANTAGLEYTFLVFLIVLIVAAVLILPALRTYPRDVVTASASVRAVNGADDTAGGGAQQGADSRGSGKHGAGKHGTHKPAA